MFATRILGLLLEMVQSDLRASQLRAFAPFFTHKLHRTQAFSKKIRNTAGRAAEAFQRRRGSTEADRKPKLGGDGSFWVGSYEFLWRMWKNPLFKEKKWKKNSEGSWKVDLCGQKWGTPKKNVFFFCVFLDSQPPTTWKGEGSLWGGRWVLLEWSRWKTPGKSKGFRSFIWLLPWFTMVSSEVLF